MTRDDETSWRPLALLAALLLGCGGAGEADLSLMGDRDAGLDEDGGPGELRGGGGDGRGGGEGRADALAFDVYPPTGELLEVHGFDPGLRHAKALAAPAVSHDPTTFQWICPPGDPCIPQPTGSGFYNVVQDRAGSDLSTVVRAGRFASGPNAGFPGTSFFAWRAGRDGGARADLLLSNTHLPEWNVPGAGDPYVGLQYTLPAGGYAGGATLADRHPLSSIRYVHLRVRARACVPDDEGWSAGRFTYYLGAWSDTERRPNGSGGLDIGFNLLRYMIRPDGGWGDGGIAEPGAARFECAYMNRFAHPTCGTTVVDIDSPSWGLLHESNLLLERLPDCDETNARLEEQPLVDIVIDVPRVLTRLVAEGLVSREYLASADYLGNMIGGIEVFGPVASRLQVEGHTLYRAVEPLAPHAMLDIVDAHVRRTDPAFLADARTFIRRDVLDIAPHCTGPGCACPAGTLHDAECGERYGRFCVAGGRVFTCTNGADLKNRWYDIGSARPCGPTDGLGEACSVPEVSCMTGTQLRACTRPPYTGPGYPNASTAPVPPPAPPVASPLPRGHYRYLGDPARPRFSVTDGGWCWFAMHTPADGGPIVDTHTSPHALGIPALGRCSWDARAANYLYTPAGTLYHYDGAGRWCWFVHQPARNGLPIEPTTVLPDAMAERMPEHMGRCPWDLDAPPPAGPPEGTLPDGLYRFVDGPGQPRFAVEGARWCWFVMREPGPIIDTARSPHSLGLEDGGRCAWDPRAGNYRYTPTGSLFHYDGAGQWCWFATPAPANGLPIANTEILPDAMGVMQPVHAGRCAWDL